MPSYQESFTTSRSLYTFAGSHLPLGGCEHELCVGVAKDTTKQGFHLCGCGPFPKDGSLHPKDGLLRTSDATLVAELYFKKS